MYDALAWDLRERENMYFAIPNRIIPYDEFTRILNWLWENLGNSGYLWTMTNTQEFLFKHETDRILFIFMFSGSIG